FRDKLVAEVDQSTFELPEILQDAVVDQGKAAVGIDMGMGIDLSHTAVGSPAGVSKADCAEWEVNIGVADLAGLLLNGNMTIDTDSHAPGVVATILKPAQ